MEKEEIGEAEEESKRNPIWYIITLFLILLIVVFVIPEYAVKLNPEPTKKVTLDDINLPGNITFENTTHKAGSKSDYLNYLTPNRPLIKQTATKIAAFACDSNRVCQAKAIFYFVRDNFDYVSDPSDEYIETAEEVLYSAGSDCDGAAILLANLEEAIGVKTRFVFVPGHVYVQIYLPESAKKYHEEGWVDLDPTCRYCDFGQIPAKNIDKPKVVVG